MEMLLSPQAQGGKGNPRHPDVRRVLPFLFGMVCGLLFHSSAQAQTTPTLQASGTVHGTTLIWTPAVSQPAGVTVAGYNVYKGTAAGKEAPPAVNGTTLVTGTTFTDTSVVPGQTAFYVVETQSTTGNQSVPSNEVSATTPNNPNPPVLTIGNVAILRQGGQDRLQVDWTDANGAATAFVIFGGAGQVLKQGSQTAANGVYSYAILIPPQSGVVSICDSSACVSKTFVGI